MCQPPSPANPVYQPSPPANPVYQPPPPGNSLYQLPPPANSVYQPPPPTNPVCKPTPPTNLMSQSVPPATAMSGPSSVTALPPPPFSTPPKLVPVEEVMKNYPGSDVAMLRRLTTALALEATFGKEEMCRSSLSGRICQRYILRLSGRSAGDPCQNHVKPSVLQQERRYFPRTQIAIIIVNLL